MLASLGATGASHRRVLLLHSFGQGFEPFSTFTESFRRQLGQQLGERVEFFDVTLDSERLEGEASEKPLVDYLTALFAGQQLDLVVPIGGAAARFGQKHRQELFRTTPMLFACTDVRHLESAALAANDAVVAVANDPARVVGAILQLLPETTNIAVVIGNSPLEQFWLSEMRRTFQPFTNRVNFVWLDQLPFAEVQKRAAALPPRTAIFYALYAVDKDGVAYDDEWALPELHKVANAPIFGLHDSQLGLGIVGGPLMEIGALGRNTAKVAVRIIRGEPAGTIKAPAQAPGNCIYDWRELRRWNISEARLPADSEIRFRQPTFWALYRWPLAAGVSICLLQAVLITNLLVNRAKRRQAEAMAVAIADISSKFVNLAPSEVEREIAGAQRRIFELLGLDISGYWQWSAEASGFFRITHHSRGGEGPQLPLEMNSREWLPWFQQQVLAGRLVAVRSIKELPPEAGRDRETFRQFGFKSNLTIPLAVGGEKPFGALGFTMRTEREWPDVLVTRLQMVAQIFANALARKRADEQLRESEERLSTSLDAAGAGAWSIELETKRVWVSASERKLFGLPSDEPITMDSFIRVIHPEDRETVRTAVEAALRTKTQLFLDYRIILPDSGVRWISARGHYRCGANGEPDRLLGVSVDVTELKRFEEALRQRNQYIETVFEQAPIGFAVHAIDDGIGRFVSARYEEIYGVPRGAIVSHHTFFETVWPNHPELREEIRRRVVADMVSGDANRMHWENVPVPLPSGETRYIMAMNIPVPSQNLVVSTVQDVTKRVRAENALRESEERFRQVAESTGDFIWEVDAQGLYTYASPSVEKMLGYTPEELVGKKHFYDLFEPSFREELKASALEAFARRQALRGFPSPNASKNGTIVHLETSGVPIFDESGNFTGYRGASADVTQRKRAEEAMLDLGGRLIAAQEAERARVARELHDGLSQNLALQAVELELLGQRPPTAAADITSRMQELSAQMKKLSTEVHRISHDLHPAKLTQLGLTAAVAELCHAGRPVHQVPMAFTHKDIPRSLPLDVALCLYRVAQESLQNVVRHSGAKQVVVELKKVQNEIHLSVADDGSGFDVESKRTSSALGLVSMRERVRLVHGRMRIESKPGKGTRVEVKVPVKG
jgi:PAS domain S-box-containing protein